MSPIFGNWGEKRMYMEQEKKRAKWDATKIILAIVAGVSVTLLALFAVITILVSSGILALATIPVIGPWLNSLFQDNASATPPETGSSYTVSDEVAITANGNIVATVADKELTNGQLQVYYWSQVYSFINDYGAYAAYFGLDFTKPFSEQQCTMEENSTWEEFFLEMALSSWTQMATIELMAEENGFSLSAQQQAELNSMIENLQKSAAIYGYKDLTEMVQAEMGKGTTAEDYIAYFKLDYLCGAYVSYLREKNAPNAAQIEEYYAANEATIKSKGYGKDAGKVVDVRHILIQPEGGVLNSDGRTYTYTDAQWEAARQKAQLVYDLWLDGEKDETSFGELAAKNSADSSGAAGGLITDIAKGNTVEGFDDWIFAEGRKYGDHALVKTVFGYHIMFYVATEEAWVRYCQANYANDIVTNQMQQFAENYTSKTEYDLIAIGKVDLAG